MLVAAGFARSSSGQGRAELRDPKVREAHQVVVANAMETWRLEWQSPPRQVCAPEDDDWRTCPCSGFAFGERGALDLVRLRSGAAEERLHLTPLFDEGPEGAEFVLQIGTLPCGKRVSVLVGLTPERPHLHVFGSTNKPTEPMHLYAGDWERLLGRARSATFREWSCGDHGAEEATERSVTITNGQFTMLRRTFECVTGLERGKLLRTEAL